jgi:hypothetical protein
MLAVDSREYPDLGAKMDAQTKQVHDGVVVASN